jgi:hypothetical protein
MKDIQSIIRIPLVILAIGALLAQCKTDKTDPFTISPGRVGKLMKEHRLSELDSVFASDSLVRDTTQIQLGRNGKVEVYEKGGAHLLTLSPTGDSLQQIGNIRIHDPRFTTDKGIGLNSTFGAIKSQYEIHKVISSLSNVLVLVKGSEAYFTISREELPASLRYTDQSIEAVQIPEEAEIKYMMVGWD